MTTWSRNEYHNGIELKFSTKPSEEELSKLRCAGWRWNPSNQVWYTKYSEENLRFAKKMCLPKYDIKAQTISCLVARFTQRTTDNKQSEVEITRVNNTVTINSTNGMIICSSCRQFINTQFACCPVCGCKMNYIAQHYLNTYGKIVSKTISVGKNYSEAEIEAIEQRKGVSKLKKEYPSVWNSEFDNVSYYYLDELEEKLKSLEATRKRKLDIQKINGFYLENCGYSFEELLTMPHYKYEQIAKYGATKEIALELLIKNVPKEALNLYKKRYVLFFEMQDLEYQKRIEKFLSYTPNHPRLCPRCNKKAVNLTNGFICSDCSGIYNGLDIELRRLDYNSGVFWQYLKVFGNKLRPVDRIAARVTSGAYSLNDESNFNFKKEQLAKLSLDTIDNVTRIIKPLFLEEATNKLSEQTICCEEYYLSAIYAYVLGQEKNMVYYLQKHIEYTTPEKIIVKYAGKQVVN